MSIVKTTVRGFTIQRVEPERNELQRWAVDLNRIHLGYIVQIRMDSKPYFGNQTIDTKFWFCYGYKKVGYRTFTKFKVSNTRTQAVLELARLSGYNINPVGKA